eukprot:15441112-Alexandrium_andersonii.AAC.1
MHPTNQAARGDRILTFRRLRGDPKGPARARRGPERVRQTAAVQHVPLQWAKRVSLGSKSATVGAPRLSVG